MPDDADAPIVPREVLERLRRHSEEWRDVDANERSPFQTWFRKFCEALRHVETLALLGEAQTRQDGSFQIASRLS